MSAAAEIQARINEFQPKIEEMARLMQAALAPIQRHAFRRSLKVVCVAIHPHRGKRARRAAFYARQREARAFERMLFAFDEGLESRLEAAYSEMLVTGLGFAAVP